MQSDVGERDSWLTLIAQAAVLHDFAVATSALWSGAVRTDARDAHLTLKARGDTRTARGIPPDLHFL